MSTGEDIDLNEEDFPEDDIESKFDRVFPKLKQKRLEDGFKKDKVVNQVLDKSTMFTMYEMINSKTISYVNGIVKAGKESVLFWAVDGNKNDVALKVFLVTTTSFKKRLAYIEGDPRFAHLKHGTRNMVYLWAKKEFRNLQQCKKAGLSVPRPISVSKNVLAMEFMGKDGTPWPTLHEAEVDEGDYEQLMKIIYDLYHKARLVHCDLSEYNVFKTDTGLVFFDLGSAVDTEHPNAQKFLERDIKNVSYFFAKRGLTVENPIDVIKKIIS